MTQCTRAVVGDQAILYRCARDLPLPDVCISTPPFVATKFSISPLTYSVSPKNMSTNQAIASANQSVYRLRRKISVLRQLLSRVGT